MSQMKNQVILTCSQCGGRYKLAHLETAQPDPDGTRLNEFMKMISKNGLCPECQARLNYNADKQRKGEQTDYVLRPTRF